MTDDKASKKSAAQRTQKPCPRPASSQEPAKPETKPGATARQDDASRSLARVADALDQHSSGSPQEAECTESEDLPEWKRLLNNRSTQLAHTIMHRRRVWWRDQHKGVHSVDDCLRTSALDRCCPFWQRKLEDKLLSRQFAQALGVPVPKLLWSGKDPRDTPFAQLEARRLPYVIKCSRGEFGKQVLLISASGKCLEFTRATPISHAQIVAHMQHAMLQYPSACILVEELVQHWDPGSQHRRRGPILYRVWIHGDRVAALYIDNQHTGLWRRPDWEPFPFLMLHEENEWLHARLKGRPPPAVYEQLLRYAKVLGVAYQVWVRIDFFITPDGPVFNEFSQTPFEGRGFTPEGSDFMMREWIAAPSPPPQVRLQTPTADEQPRSGDQTKKRHQAHPVGQASAKDPAQGQCQEKSGQHQGKDQRQASQRPHHALHVRTDQCSQAGSVPAPCQGSKLLTHQASSVSTLPLAKEPGASKGRSKEAAKEPGVNKGRCKRAAKGSANVAKRQHPTSKTAQGPAKDQKAKRNSAKPRN